MRRLYSVKIAFHAVLQTNGKREGVASPHSICAGAMQHMVWFSPVELLASASAIVSVLRHATSIMSGNACSVC